VPGSRDISPDSSRQTTPPPPEQNSDGGGVRTVRRQLVAVPVVVAFLAGVVRFAAVGLAVVVAAFLAGAF
jgi:hypothetical protein